jgi:S-adenosylmethionine:tRNA ribosyltransferase-isomerase
MVRGASTHVSKMFLSANRDMRQSYVYTEGMTAPVAMKDGRNEMSYASVSGRRGPEILMQLREKMQKAVSVSEELQDAERYQTVYSRNLGSAAAPTAGLHFTPELISALKAKGVEFATVELKVGLGTFRPVKEDDLTNHKMHTEWYEITSENAEIINKAKREGRRVIAVGTTSVRTLESVADDKGFVKAQSGDTSIFIYPPYKFKCVDGIITNFHLPESTLIMLISAFLSREKVLDIYKYAVDNNYRFFSFGDACLFL